LKDGEARAAGADLETSFFDFEVDMEGEVCRDSVCMDTGSELQYLQDLSEVLCFLMLPKNEFRAGPVRCLVREILTCSLIQPGFEKIADPDFVNQTIVWLYSDTNIKTEVFVSVLRHTDNMGELDASRDLVLKEISRLRSRDSASDGDGEDGRLQLNSMLFLKKVLETKVNRIQSGFSGNSYGLPANIDWSSKLKPNTKLFALPLEVILKNNIALSYFIDYMTAIGCQYLVFFYLNIEGWKVSTEQQLQAIELDLLKTGETNEKFLSNLETIREAALSIYQEYLSDKASQRIQMDDSLNKKLLLKIRSEPPDPGWFDEVAAVVYNQLQQNEKFLRDFKRSVGYLKLLAELDLLKGELEEEDEVSFIDSASLGSFTDDGSSRSIEGKSESSGSDGSLGQLDIDSYHSRQKYSDGSPRNCRKEQVLGHPRSHSGSSLGKSDLSELSAEIVDIDLAKEKGTGKQYVNYIVSVRRGESRWEVVRRYSDFLFLQQTLVSQFSKLSRIPFPGKKTFGNLEKNVVEKRRKMMTEFFRQISNLKSGDYPGLYDQIFMFLSPGWEVSKQNVLERTVSAVSYDIQRTAKSVSTVVSSMPRNVLNNVDNVMDGLTKALHIKSNTDGEDDLSHHMKVGAGLQQEHDQDNIPLRIILLLLDEVFDLADRNIWLRRQMITVLRQIVKTMFGDKVNKKIVDYFTQLTTPSAVSEYLTNIQEHLWPSGVAACPAPERGEDVKSRTRVAAKAALFSSLPDELRRVIGSETSRAGLAMLFEMLQHSSLNKRLILVVLEGVIKIIFPSHDFENIFMRLHSRSARIRNDLKNSKRSPADLRRR